MTAWIVHGLVTGGAVALAAVVLIAVLRPSAAGRHALWLVALLALLLPPVGHWPVALPTTDMPLPHHTNSSETGAAPPHMPPAAPPARSLTTYPGTSSGPADAPPPASGEWAPAGSPDPPAIPWLAITWALGAFVAAGRLVRQHAAVRALVRRASPPPAGLARLLGELTRVDGGRVACRVTRELETPCIAGVLRPVLLVPETLARGDRRTLEPVLLHELAHVTRGDHLTGGLAAIAGVAWWWNPICWFVRRRLEVEAELACDARVVARRPSCRRVYAEALVDVASAHTARYRMAATGLGSATRREFEKRLEHIMTADLTAGRRYTLCALALLVLALPGWTPAPAAAAPAGEAPAKLGSFEPTPYLPVLQDADDDSKVELTREQALSDDVRHLEIDVESGTIMVHRGEGKHMRAQIVLRSQEGVDAELSKVFTDHVSWKTDGDRVTLYSKHRRSEQTPKPPVVNLHVWLPRALSPKLRLATGAMHLGCASGDVTMTLDTGPITVDVPDAALGSVSLSLGSGPVSVKAAVTDELAVRQRFGPADVKLRDGMPSRGALVETAAGPISVTLGKVDGVEVDAATAAGRIALPKDSGLEAKRHGTKAHFKQRLGRGGPALKVRTAAGNISLAWKGSSKFV